MTSEPQTILIVYYSETGHTRAAAQALDEALDATVEPLSAPLLSGRRGFWMFCWRTLTAIVGRAAEIEPPRHDPAGFGLVVLASPVWAGRLSTPMRSYIERFRRRFGRVAFVTTQSGANDSRAFADFARLTGHAGIARLSLSDADRRQHRDAKKLADFAERLKTQDAPD
jgi:hypothetical protein